MLLEQTLQQLRALRLHGMVSALEHQLSNPEFHQLSFGERIGLLVDHETLDRSNRRVTDLLRKAKLRQAACIEDIDYQQPRGLDKNFRLLMAHQLLTGGLLMAHNWNTYVSLAAHEYPVPWMNPSVEAFLGIAAQIGGCFSLLLGL